MQEMVKGKRIPFGANVGKIIFPAALLVFPLLLINQGVDISDTTYSLGYYRFMEEMDATWVLATYLANVAGAFLMRLPMGNTLLGMNLYTGLLAAGIALLCYAALSKWMPSWIAFLGEIIALGLCWCPTTILYNYLTYLLFAAGSLLLCQALFTDRGVYYALAGVCLGLNVMVRFSNLAEAALILAVWYKGWLCRDKAAVTLKRTGLCLAGYLAGFGGVLLLVGAQYGAGAFGSMVESLFGMTEEASDYTLWGMVSATADAYLAGIRWMAYMVPCQVAGTVLFMVKKGRYEKGKRVLYCIGIAILLRFYWGQGMFSLRYYNEGCIFQWMMLFLIVSAGCAAAGICGYFSPDRRERLAAAVALLILLLTPLGSNNYTYQNMNNLFLVAPYTLWACYRLLRRTGWKAVHFPWQAFLVLILCMTFIQGIGFGLNYVFRDGIYGEKREAKVENSVVLKGMYTTQENAESLTGLIAFCEESGVTKEPVLIWGDAPGLSYILDVPSAIFTTWPEIPSNTYGALDRALMELEWEPAVILHHETGRPVAEGEKADLILDYIASHSYICVYENNNYQVYAGKGAGKEAGGKTKEGKGMQGRG